MSIIYSLELLLGQWDNRMIELLFRTPVLMDLANVLTKEFILHETAHEGTFILGFDVVFDDGLNQVLNRQSICRWFVMLWSSYDAKVQKEIVDCTHHGYFPGTMAVVW